MARRSSWPGRLLAALAFLALAVVLTLGNLWAFLRTPWGARVLAGQLEERISAEIAGSVRVGKVGTFGALGFRLEHVLILDPRGDPTIAVERLRLKLVPWRLLTGTLSGEVDIAGARVALVELPAYDDLNIGATFEPPEPSPDEEEESPPGPKPPLPPDPPLPIELRRLHIERTAFLLVEERGADPQVLVRDIEIRGSGRWDSRGAEAELVLGAQVLQPVTAPLSVDVQGAFAENWLDALRADVVLGETELRVKGRGEMRALEGRLVVGGDLGPAQARQLGIPLASTVGLDADIWLSRMRSSVGLRASTEEGGVLSVDGWFELPEGTLFAQAILAGVDPAAWMSDAPRGELSGSLRAVGGLLPAPDLRLSVQLQEGRLASHPVGPVQLQGRLAGTELLLEPSSLQIPGALLRFEGQASADALDLQGSLQASDLATAAGFGAALLGEELPEMAGRGTLSFDIRGAIDAPLLEAELDFPRLAFEGLDARGLALRGSGSLGAEGLPVGRLEGSVERLLQGRLEAHALDLDVERREGGAFSLDASASTSVASRQRAREGRRTRLRARGELGPESAAIDAFRLDFPEGSLRSEGRATLDFGAGDFSIEGLELQQRGEGSLAASGGIRGQRLDLELRGRDLRLDLLPQELLPEDLSGEVDLEANLTGTLQAPEGRVRFRLREGRFADLADMAGSGTVRFDAGRAAGDVRMALGGAGLVEGSFSLPLDVMDAPNAAPISLDLQVGPVDLAGLGRTLDADLPEGTLRGRVVGGGRIGRPDLDVELLLSEFEIPDAPGLPQLAAMLRGTLHEGRALVDLEAWAAQARVLEMEASAPLDPRRLRSEPEAEVARMLASPESRAEGVIRALDLTLVGALIDQPDLGGAVVSEFDVRGPIVDPRGTVRLEMRGGPLGPVRHLSLVSLVELLPERSRLVAGVSVDDEPPAEIRAEVAAPPRAFLDGTAPPSTPVELVIDVPRIRLAALGGRPATAGVQALVEGAAGEAQRMDGTIRAQGRFSGTLASLPGKLRVVGEDLVVHGVPLGGAELNVEQDERIEGRLSVIDPTAGTLQARLGLDGSISPLALAERGTDFVTAMHAAVEVRGTGLSLAPLAIASNINRAGGSLDIEALAEGVVAELDPVGTVALREGTIELVGGPRYQDITVDLELTGERLLLARLAAAAPGRGRLRADGRLQREPGPDPFQFELEADRFPIGGPGGVSARLSAEGDLQGRFHPRQGVVAELEVPQARIELPPSPPRELQSVDRLDEVVIVSGPEAFLRERRTRRAERETALPIDLRLDAPRRIFVVGEDVDAELGAELHLRRLEDGELLAEGEVRARRGRVRVLGRSFQVEEAAALWGGGDIANPVLALTARYQARDATAWVDVTGTAASPVIALRSEPPLPESQIALLIAAGRTSLPGQSSPFGEPAEEETGIDPAGAAASVAGAFAAQQLRQALGPRLPLDVLTLETGGTGTRLEAGTYVSERLYLGYLRNFLPQEGENLNEVRAEYELSRTVSLESRFGDRGAAGVDLVWEKRIATPGQQRARREAYRERYGIAPPELIGPQEEEPIRQGEDAPAGYEPDPARREEEADPAPP